MQMRMKLFAIVVISISMLLAASCQSTGPLGTVSKGDDALTGSAPAKCDRACLEKYVDQYMDAMISHESNPQLFAENCRFTENGARLQLGEGLWSTLVGKGTYKFYIPDLETQQVAFLGTAREEGYRPGEGTPVTIALRLKIQNSRITEAEQLVFRPQNNLSGGSLSYLSEAAVNFEKLGSPHKVYSEIIPEAERPLREEMIKTANYYFSGLQLNDGKGYYPFTDDCERIENGMLATNVPLKPGEKRPDPRTAAVYSDAWGCKEQFESGLARFVTRIRDRRYVAVDRERGIVFSFVYFDHAAGKTRHYKAPNGRDVVAGPTEPWTWQIAELFKVEKGKIRRIEAVMHRVPYGMNSGWSTYEQGMSDQIQIIK
jgi:hypothetical protein